jgi:hypothetical protein
MNTQVIDRRGEWSVSALKTIGTCGKQYHWSYRQTTARREKTIPLVFGSAVHKIIERMHDLNEFGPGYWMRAWSEEWSTKGTELPWGGKNGTFNGYSKLGAEMLANYASANKGAKLLAVERSFPNQKGEVIRIGKHVIKGVIDQIRELPDGRLMVLDLKTSKEPLEPLLLHSDPQFTFYAVAIKQIYGAWPCLALYHLKSGELLHTTRDETDVCMVEQMLDEAQQRVDLGMFTRNVGFHCKYCPWTNECLGPFLKEAVPCV